MKKLFLVLSLVAVGLTGTASADIQAPPGSQFTPTRKLGRALSNILYGFTEIPEQIVRKQAYGRKGGYTYGFIDGTRRTFRRLGYGFYELVTFHCPTSHGTFKPPYSRCGEDGRIEMNPHDGLSEFPPQLGFESSNYSRTQSY